MSTITKERLQKLIRAIDCGSYDEEEIVGWVNSDEILELARFRLASLEAEPVAWRYRTTDIKGNPLPNWSFSEEASLLGLYQPLYAVPPAMVSVPDEIAATLIAAIAKEQDRLFGQDYLMDSKDCIDVIREEMDRIKARRAAMLQGADDEIGSWHNDKNTPTLREEVSALRNSGVDIDAEKILTERDALNSPVIPDGYALVPVEPTAEMIAAAMFSDDVLFDKDDDTMFRVQHAVIWRSMLAAAPRQEVKS